MHINLIRDVYAMVLPSMASPNWDIFGKDSTRSRAVVAALRLPFRKK